MKRFISLFLTVFLLMSVALSCISDVFAASKTSEPRAIAIVFDNSGSMYMQQNQAWCRATYAMEVFASMLNIGDTLMIYPMWPIQVGGREYSMQNPMMITDVSQASSIREIFTPDAGGTPIESVDSAIAGLSARPESKKCLVVLTDGGSFSKNGYDLSVDRTIREMDKRVQEYAGKNMMVMYLGIGANACVPSVAETEYFAKRKAVNSEDALSILTDMCNMIFGRDTLPANHITGNNIDFDISMSKMIVAVQGENISNVKLTDSKGDSIGKMVGTQQTKFSTAGAGDYKSIADTTLQGLIVTYADCAAGTYKLDFSGTATSIAVYYEPDADLDFVFTDADGNNVDPESLYEGEYKVSFGMKDAKTGELISSDLLGNPRYQGSYFINDQEYPIVHEGASGEEPVQLHMNDSFDATLTATYLSGYTITKDSSDFGWPSSGIRVAAPPLGKFELSLDVPQKYFVLNELKDGKPITANLLLDGKKLTHEEFAAVTLTVECGGIDCAVTPVESEGVYRIQLLPTTGLKEGKYALKVRADYSDEAGRVDQAEKKRTLTVSKIPLWARWVSWILLILIIIAIIWLISHIRVLPKYAHVTKRDSTMIFDGEDESKSTTFMTKMEKGQMVLNSKFAGSKCGVAMEVKPGKESYLYKSQTRRYSEVRSASVRKFGSAVINEATIGGVKYLLNEDTGKLERTPKNDKPFMLKNGTTINYSGTMLNGGVPKAFTVTTKLNFKKK